MPRSDRQQAVPTRVSRRAVLQGGVAAGLTAAVAPVLARAAHLAAVDLGGARPAVVQQPDWPVPPIVTRAEWGADEALRKPGVSYDTGILKLIVHHTGTPNDITDYAGLCRGIMANETAGEYLDIAYNWLIDPNGLIYEGRWADDYPSGAPHTGERNGANVRGAHAIYNNIRTIGVALMGTYDDIDPPSAMVNALVTLLTWKCARWGIDPLARAPYLASNFVLENIDNICGHRDTSPTDCPGQRTEPMLPAIRQLVAGRLSGGGYWIASSTGQVLAFGGAPPTAQPNFAMQPVAGIAGVPAGTGYWLFTADGSVYSFGTARYFGSMHGRRLASAIVGMASTPTGAGYWLVGGDGGIFAFGDARFFGSTGNLRLAAPVLGLAPTPSGRGYWIYARDGGIFSYGDARFFGSTGSLRLNQPIVGMAARPQGDGYWLVASDGGMFAFGNAPFKGSGVGIGSAPYVAFLPSTTGNGYALLRRDGSVSTFGDAPYLGSAAGQVGVAVGIAGRLKPL